MAKEPIKASENKQLLNGKKKTEITIPIIDSSEEEEDLGDLGRVQVVQLDINHLVKQQGKQYFDEIADMRMSALFENGKDNRKNLVNIFDAYPEADPRVQRRQNR